MCIRARASTHHCVCVCVATRPPPTHPTSMSVRHVAWAVVAWASLASCWFAGKSKNKLHEARAYKNRQQKNASHMSKSFHWLVGGKTGEEKITPIHHTHKKRKATQNPSKASIDCFKVARFGKFGRRRWTPVCALMS